MKKNLNDLYELKALSDKHLHAINQLSLGEWVALAKTLGVAGNEREEAAGKLGAREFNAKRKASI